MIKKFITIFSIVVFFSLFACANNPDTPPQQSLTAPPPAPVHWTGDGGSGIRIAVLEPAGTGLAISERWILSMVQSSITGDFQTFSAMTVVDRLNLDTILAEQRQALSGDYSDEDTISIGRLTHARYILTGSITRTADAYMLELSITDVESGQRKASYPPTAVSASALENLSAIREATAELLRQLGVELTDQGWREIQSVRNTAQVQAETALARGITAQRQGTVVEALSYFIQASSYDSGLAEALSRMNVLSADITSGNIGEDTRNEIAWRRQWVERLQETEALFTRNTTDPQPFFIVYSTDIQRGSIDFQRETIDLSIRIGFYPDFVWSNQINSVITSIKDGLQATGRTEAWGLNWPVQTIGTPSPFNDRTRNATATVVVEIINDQGRSISSQTVRTPYGFDIANFEVIPQWQWEGTVTFPAVDANLITDRLVIRITSIDGIAAERAAREKRISIMPHTEWEVILRTNPTSRRGIESARAHQRAEELRMQADEHLRNGYFSSAITDYTESIRLNGNDVIAYIGRGNAYSRQGDVTHAIADWERALRINPYLAEASQSLATARQQQQREQEQREREQREREQREQREQEQRERAHREQQEREQQEREQQALALFDQGRNNYNIRDFDRAISNFTAAIRLNPNLVQAYSWRGAVYTQLANESARFRNEVEIRNRDNAISDYSHVIRLSPNDASAFNNRGNAYRERANSIAIRGGGGYDSARASRISSDRNNAIRDYTEAIRLNPNNAVYFNNRGIAYESIYNYSRARADFQDAIRLDPNNATYRNNFNRVQNR